MTPFSGASARRVAALCLSVLLLAAMRVPVAGAAEEGEAAIEQQSALALTLFSQVCAERIGRPYEAQAALEALPLKLADIAAGDLPPLPIEPDSTVKAWAVASPAGPVLVALIDNHRCVVQAEPVDGAKMREMLGTIIRGMEGSPAPVTLEQHETRSVAMGESEAVQEYWVIGGRADGVKVVFIALGPKGAPEVDGRWIRLTASLAK